MRTVWWQGIDDPDRIDRASISIDERVSTPFVAEGVSNTSDYRLNWQLDTGPGYLTRRLLVSIASASGLRSLDLRRDEHGRWTTHGEEGAATIEAVAGADDCDLGLCPVTNSMPMLRSVLPRKGTTVDAPGPEHQFLMAWVEVPSLRVLASGQLYRLISASADRFVVRYTSQQRDFTADLLVDPDGVVVDYPQLARRIPIRDESRREPQPPVP